MTTNTDVERLIAEAEAALEGVTPGPWHVGQGDRVPFVAGAGFARADFVGPEKDRLPNASFTAWARNNVPTLIAALRAMQGRESMTTPERIWVWETKDPIGSSRGWNTSPHNSRTEYVRRDAAEAKLAEVEKERDKISKTAVFINRTLDEVAGERDQLQATIATLTARVEAMRGALERIEAYGFTCEAGPLSQCQEWINLKEAAGCHR